ncbi:MAG: hypothetical protein WB729_13410 [Candidatus Sulfotelmatobacter sp.]
MKANIARCSLRLRGKYKSPFAFFFFLVSLGAVAADSANITFSLNFPGSDPESYSISLDSNGHAKYESLARISTDSEDRETYQTEFQFSSGNRARIFELAGQSHYFAGKIDSGNHKIAFTGAKKLTYRDGSRSNTAEFNYSSLPPVQQAVAIFQNVAATMEFGRRLAHYHRYQKLALDDELKRMEAEAQDNQLCELQAIEPTLKEIFEDTSVMNVVRARAQRLIDLGKK